MPQINMLIKPASGFCNMRCDYCFYCDVAQNRETENFGLMSRETQETLVRKALEYADGSCNFAFQGGEPTLAGLEFFKRQVELQKKYNIKNVIVTNALQTNGYGITEEWASFFAENNFLVGLSLDGPRDIHDILRKDASGEGTFDRIMVTVEMFNKYKVEYNILTVVNKYVAQNPKDVYSFFKSKGFRYLQFIECLDPFDAVSRDYSLTSEDYADFMKAVFDEYYNDFMKGRYISVRSFDNYISILIGRPPEACGMSGSCTAYHLVESNGNVYPCDFYVLDEWRLGNVNDDKLFDMINSSVAKNFVDVSRSVHDECKKCKYYKLCRGGCRRDREPFVNGVPSQNKYCKAYKAFFDKNIDRLIGIARMLSLQK